MRARWLTLTRTNRFIYLSAAPIYIAVNPRDVSRSEEDPAAARMLAAQSTISDCPHDIFFLGEKNENRKSILYV